ncbi:MAG: PDZ domain-containing protein [Planctomycetaceae bacterium]
MTDIPEFGSPSLPLSQIRLRVWLLIVTVLIFGSPNVPNAAADDRTDAVRSAVEKVAESVVRIRLIGDTGGGDVSSRVTTGVVISEEGFVISSVFGFTGQAAAVFVENASGERSAAKVVATDHVRKLVLLKCEQQSWTVPKFSNQQWPEVGAWAIAAGRFYPAASPAVSVGIVSAVNRIHGLAIQTDAKISPVNYGGPLIDVDGQVMGILVPLSPQDRGEAIEAGVEWYDSGIGFAIPMADVLKTADLLRSGQDRVSGLLGVAFGTRNPLAAEVPVKVVHPRSPAAEAGLKPGDIITSINGTEVRRYGNIESIVKSSYAGDVLKLQFRRGDERIDASLTLTDKLHRPVRGYLGLVVDEAGIPKEATEKPHDDEAIPENAPDPDASEKETPKKLEVPVRILPDSPLAKAGMPGQALLVRLNDEPFSNVLEFRTQLGKVAVDEPLTVKWRSSAGADEQTLEVTPIRRPGSVLAMTDDLRKIILGEAASAEWQRTEQEFDDDGKTWIYAPKSADAVRCGIVMLLSESNNPPDAVLDRWKDVCERDRLILVVPIPPDGGSLNAEHQQLVERALVLAASKSAIDVDRIVLVAGRAQAEFATGQILQLRRRRFRSAVFVDSWPTITGVREEVLSATVPNLLFLNGSVQSRQAQALQQQSVSAFRKAAAWVIGSDVPENDSTESAAGSVVQTIADWATFLQVR